MAHECPNCGMTCFCNGDISDMIFNDPGHVHNCQHCYENDDDNDFKYTDWEEDWEDN